MYTRGHKNFFQHHQKFNHHQFFKADIYSAHIDLIIFFLNHLADHQDDVVFQPMAQHSMARTKTNWRPDDRLDSLENFLLNQCVPDGYLHWKMTYG